MSFKNESILSMYAGADKEHDDILISHHKDKVLPSVIVYGANAAGKSNINKALQFAIAFVRQSNRMQVNDQINIVPFLLDQHSRYEKSKFDFIFVHHGIKYEYGFVVDQNNVYEEYLYEYTSSKASMIFERTNINQYRYTSKTKKELSAIENKNTDNKLFLSTATMWNSSYTKNAFLWFLEGIDVFDSSNLFDSSISLLTTTGNDEMKKFMKKILKNADLNIVDYKFNRDDKEWKLTTYHQIEDQLYEFPFQAESKGTLNYFCLGPVIKDALEKGKTIVIDEIDSGLHPMLVKYLIGIFHNTDENINGAQIIVNTHDIAQLTLDQFRRDQIYFVEKNYFTGISDLYSLDEYSPRKSENIQKGYLLGRYGAIPVVGTEDIQW